MAQVRIVTYTTELTPFGFVVTRSAPLAFTGREILTGPDDELNDLPPELAPDMGYSKGERGYHYSTARRVEAAAAWLNTNPKEA